MVETNNGNDCPVSTLAAPVYPMIALAAPRCLISQSGSPGSEFSATTRRRGPGFGALTGLAGAAAGLPLHAEVTAIAAPATPNAPRPRNVRLLAPPEGAEPLGTSPSRVMADRMHPRRRTRKRRRWRGGIPRTVRQNNLDYGGKWR